MSDLPDHDRFSLPNRIPDASDPSWRLPPAEREADWRARGLLHPAGRGWTPVPGSRGPRPLGDAYDDSPRHRPAGGPPPRGGEARPAPGSKPWPQGWLPGDPPVEYVDRLSLEMEGDPAAAMRVFDAAARVRFLDCLATLGEVRAAATRVGVSHETCYRARRRCIRFAQLWDAALVLARARAEGELATRAFHGVKVPVFVRGECVATWYRQDYRYMSEHLRRLDRRIESDPASVERAGRFDELTAAYVGLDAPYRFAEAAEEARESREPASAPDLPPTREEYVRWARGAALQSLGAGADAEAEARAMAEAAELAGEVWDAWHEESLALVGEIVGGEQEREEESAPASAGEEEEAPSQSSELDPEPRVSGEAAEEQAGPPVEPGVTKGAEDEGDPDSEDPPVEVKSAPAPNPRKSAAPERVTRVNTPPVRLPSNERRRQEFAPPQAGHGSARRAETASRPAVGGSRGGAGSFSPLPSGPASPLPSGETRCVV